MDALDLVVRGVIEGRLSVADCRLLLCVRIMQALATTAVACTTLPTARTALARIRPLAIACRGAMPEARVIWAFQASERWQRGRGRCLARAVAAEVLLERTPDRPRLVIGVAAPVDGALRSHAWIERNGRVLIGRVESGPQYVPLVSWISGTR